MILYSKVKVTFTKSQYKARKANAGFDVLYREFIYIKIFAYGKENKT